MQTPPIRHDYHLAAPSPWPFTAALSLFITLTGLVMWLNPDAWLLGIPPFIRPWILGGGLCLLAYTCAGWGHDIITESVQFREYKPVVMLSFRFGMAFFMLFEAIVFIYLFWVYFAFAFGNSGGWPPAGVLAINPWRLPLLATMVIMLSSTTVTWAHREIGTGNMRSAQRGLILTLVLGLFFLALVLTDILHPPFSFGFNSADLRPFADPAHIWLEAQVGSPEAIFGSIFILVVAVFCLHTLFGLLFLFVNLMRVMAGHFTPKRHFGFEAAAWYWHFGAGVWLLLYACLYVLSYARIGHG